jgi:hypothetical protein
MDRKFDELKGAMKAPRRTPINPMLESISQCKQRNEQKNSYTEWMFHTLC